MFEEEVPEDPKAQLVVTKQRLEALTKLVEEQKAEMAKLKERNDELNEQKQAVELQKETQCSQFRDLLKEKEDELNLLKQSFVPDVIEEPLRNVANESRIVALETQIRNERETHQNEMVALQEALSGRAVLVAHDDEASDLAESKAKLEAKSTENEKLVGELTALQVRLAGAESSLEEMKAIVEPLREEIEALRMENESLSHRSEHVLQAEDAEELREQLQIQKVSACK